MMKVKEITAILEEIHGVSLMEDTVDGINGILLRVC